MRQLQRVMAKYKKFLKMEDDGSLDKLHGKESAAIKRQMSRMKRNFEGMLNLKRHTWCIIRY